MTSPNPMALEAKALELDKLGKAMGRLLADSDAAYKRWLADAERAAALPPPAAGEGLEPVAWRWRWGKLGSNTAWHFSPVKPGPFPEEGYEVEPLYADRRTRPPASSMEGWRTMDSAPKDRPFLAFDPRRGRYVCFWGPIYLSRRPLGWVPAGEQSGAEAHPTHWQPLPSSPIPPEVMK